jgi:hypothetical protein
MGGGRERERKGLYRTNEGREKEMLRWGKEKKIHGGGEIVLVVPLCPRSHHASFFLQVPFLKTSKNSELDEQKKEIGESAREGPRS